MTLIDDTMQINTGRLVEVSKVQAATLLFKALTGQKIKAADEAASYFLQLGQALMTDSQYNNETPVGSAKLKIKKSK